jgi:hypothetical protein
MSVFIAKACGNCSINVQLFGFDDVDEKDLLAQENTLYRTHYNNNCDSELISTCFVVYQTN